MPTQNRRVATYLPETIALRFNAFKEEKGIKGDSAALIAILEAFFGVSQKEAYSSSSESIAFAQRVEAVEEKISDIKSELLSELKSELEALFLTHPSLGKQIDSNIEEKDHPGQLSLLAPEPHKKPIQKSLEQIISKPESELIAQKASTQESREEGDWLTTKEAWEGLHQPAPYDTFRKLSPDELSKRYGLQCDPDKKRESKYSPRWLKMAQDTQEKGFSESIVAH